MNQVKHEAKKMIKTVTLILTFVCIFLTACSAPVKKPVHSGFLSDYSQLKTSETRKNHMGYRSEKLPQYKKIIIDPVAMVYMEDDQQAQFTPQELEDLQTFADQALIKVFNADDSNISVVNEPGENIARMRIAITDVKRSFGALNVALLTKFTGAGLGGIAVEGELLDSITGEQLGAAIHWGNGSRVLRAGFTKTGDAKILLKRWSKELKNKLSSLVSSQT